MTIPSGITSSIFISDGNGNIRMMANSVGNVGIGTTGPNSPLHVYSNTPGAIRLQDTSEGPGKVLISDANGVGTWQTIGTASSLGTVNKYATTITNGSISPNVAITITHNLISTDITATAWDVSLDEMTFPKFSNRTSNSIDVTFTSIPAGNIRIVITS